MKKPKTKFPKFVMSWAYMTSSIIPGQRRKHYIEGEKCEAFKRVEKN